VTTKFRKTFDTWFFPIGEDIERIVADWVRFLGEERGWSLDDPLFPATKIEVGPTGHFEPNGLSKDHWKGTGPIRTVFREAFKGAGGREFQMCSLVASQGEHEEWGFRALAKT
jgi:integrase/recombinase XerD